MKSELFTVVWSFRNRFDVLKQSILSAHKTCPTDVKFLLVDGASSDETIRQLRELTLSNELKNRNIKICESFYRTTCQEAWNLGLMLSDTRYVIISSSDVQFHSPEWFFHFYNLAVNTHNSYILANNHALFCLDKKMIHNVGWFDENYSHGPHVDVDYMIRASELGYNVSIFGTSSYSHGDTEEEEELRKTINLPDRLIMNNTINEDYFRRKWISSWEGWARRVHPPTHISQVQRAENDINFHPGYLRRFKDV